MAKILIVDDNEQNCELMHDVVVTWGHDVYKVYQGMEAIEFAVRNQPDVILLDVMLPGMNGFEVCRELKRNPKTNNIHIIMLTALNDVEDRIRGFKVGADSFITKPANYNELKYIIASRLKRKQAIDGMESQQQVCASFLKIMKRQNAELYRLAIERRETCDKAGRLLALPERQLSQLLIAACLCDIGDAFQGADDCGHEDVGEEILKPLKMGEWLRIFLRCHHQKVNSIVFSGFVAEAPEHLAGLQILVTVIRYLELCAQIESKDESLRILQAEAQQGDWDTKAVAALQQLRKDETFIQKLKAGK
ncbi:MAG: response regulator [Negativicutes bacterium]